MNDPTPLLSGGCQCGAVRYAISGPTESAGVCYCRMCQKAVGGPFFAWVAVACQALEWTRGEPAVFRSSSVATRGFCARCGTPLTFQYDSRPNSIDVAAGSLDRPGEAAPTKAMGIEGRLPWCDTLNSLPASATGAVNPPAELATLVNFQHPDHDTPADWQPPAGGH